MKPVAEEIVQTGIGQEAIAPMEIVSILIMAWLLRMQPTAKGMFVRVKKRLGNRSSPNWNGIPLS